MGHKHGGMGLEKGWLFRMIEVGYLWDDVFAIGAQLLSKQSKLFCSTLSETGPGM